MARTSDNSVRPGSLRSVTASTTPTKSTTVTLLRVFAVLTALGTLAQALIGGYNFTAHRPELWGIHSTIGLVTIVAAIVATVFAGLNRKAGGNKGLVFHGLGMAIFLLIQYALGEMAMAYVHIVFGIIVLIGAIALAVLSIRKPFRA